MSHIEILSRTRCHGGWQVRVRHDSVQTNCPMVFSVYLPPAAEQGSVPAVLWLSGLTCTDENFSQKSGAQAEAAALGLALIIPDTSPRGDCVPDDAQGAYDFGKGAGFYLDATEAPWSKHYRMQSYVLDELLPLVRQHFAINESLSVSGHSMGGHGALIFAAKFPKRFRSVSAFSPLAHPMECAWGKKAFGLYLGDNMKAWRNHDAVELIREHGLSLPLRVDQGLDDEFYDQLMPKSLEEVLKGCENEQAVHFHEHYDHSYYFVQSFIAEHLAFHAQHLIQS